jgi:hypothetical protein
MIGEAVFTVAAGYGGGRRVVERETQKPTNGRQDKSAACGPAHVVGWIEDFGHLAQQRRWRFQKMDQAFQRSERHPRARRARLWP